jgi:hypothetical protein
MFRHQIDNITFISKFSLTEIMLGRVSMMVNCIRFNLSRNEDTNNVRNIVTSVALTKSKQTNKKL